MHADILSSIYQTLCSRLHVRYATSKKMFILFSEYLLSGISSKCGPAAFGLAKGTGVGGGFLERRPAVFTALDVGLELEGL